MASIIILLCIAWVLLLYVSVIFLLYKDLFVLKVRGVMNLAIKNNDEEQESPAYTCTGSNTTDGSIHIGDKVKIALPLFLKEIIQIVEVMYNEMSASRTINLFHGNKIIPKAGTRARSYRPSLLFHRFFTVMSLLLQVPLFQSSFQFRQVSASIYIENNTYPSLPALFGRYMVADRIYTARLQYFPNNPYLCSMDEKTLHKFVPPTGGVVISHIGNSNLTVYEESVAILAVRGNCPFQQKAQVVEMMDDSIKVLLIANFNLDNIPEEDDTIIPMFSQHGDTRLVVLGISHATGQALKKYLSEMPDNTTKLGGPIIQFDSISTDDSLTDLESLIFSAMGIFFMLLSFTGCLIIVTGTYHQLLMVQQQENGSGSLSSITQRRLLTEDEVRQFIVVSPISDQNDSNGATINVENRSTSNLAYGNHAALSLSSPEQPLGWRQGNNDSEVLLARDNDDDNVEEDQCAVCLGELNESGDDNAQIVVLPCHHQFHTTCITPWLTERQSKCPLCKYDILQHIRTNPNTTGDVETSLDSESSDSTDLAHDSTTSTSRGHMFIWDQLRRYRWTSLSTNPPTPSTQPLHATAMPVNDEQQHVQMDGIFRIVQAISSSSLSSTYNGVPESNEDDNNIGERNLRHRNDNVHQTAEFEMTEQQTYRHDLT